MVHILSVLTLLVTVRNAISNERGRCSDYCQPYTCPKDITQLAFASGYKTDCKQIATRAPCINPDCKYRTIDGSCNDLSYNRGATNAEIERLLPPDYDDYCGSPRQYGVDGTPLPSARNLSVNVHTNASFFANRPLTIIIWGQWIAHDCTAATLPSGRLTCCGVNGTCPPFATNRNCFPIELPRNDPTLPGVCMNFVRTQAAMCYNNETIRPRVQTNDVTSYIDSSQIYGSDKESAQAVREPESFLLLSKYDNFPAESNSTCNKRNGTTDYCFLAGDGRSNQHTYLSCWHTLWHREHNRIATELRALNADLSNEEIFQITKKMITGMTQSITYNEYLPEILGDDVNRWKLLSKSGRSYYNPKLNPTLFQEFVSAAFRFGHSQIPTEMPVGDVLMPLKDLFNSPGFCLDYFTDIITAMARYGHFEKNGIEMVDKHVTDQLSRFLFFAKSTGRGGDLVSTNIQRGRDVGLPPYVKVREFCCLPPVKGFNDTEALGPGGQELAKYYKVVEDIDLYTGMLHEPVDRGLLGPTFRCLIGIQFFRLKNGDRFFFDNDQRHLGFTDRQLAAIRSVKLAGLMCRHSNVTYIQPNVFQFPSESNKEVPCSSLEELDLHLFV